MEYIEKKQLNALYDEDAVTMKGWAMIKQMPTIDIVCCQNCAWSDDDGCYEPFTWCNAYNFGVMDKTKHFCATGERRTE